VPANNLNGKTRRIRIADLIHEVIAAKRPVRRARVKRRELELRQKYDTLASLRKALGITQQDLAIILGIDQANISAFEQRADHKTSSLYQYLVGMGGVPVLLVRFDNHEVDLTPVLAAFPPEPSAT
jgi:DNA-binding transcriptional regulator YiaG